MQKARVPPYLIREARPQEYATLGRLIVNIYAALPGIPQPQEQPDYYQRLLHVEERAHNSAIRIFIAVGESGEALGCVDFIQDMVHYSSGGTASTVPDAAGIRLLAVSPAARGLGIGKALTRYCIEQAQALGKNTVILHTTHAMQTAWTLYERMGFQRFPEIDFKQGNLEVFGFRLALPSRDIR